MPELQMILTYRGEEVWQQNDGEGNPLACACGMRGPSPYDEGAFCLPYLAILAIRLKTGKGCTSLFRGIAVHRSVRS